MRIRDLKPEVWRQNDDIDIIDAIVGDARKYKKHGKLLLAGFEGLDVVTNRSFGDRWYTYAKTEEEARTYSSEGGIIEFAFGAEHVPMVAVFDGDILSLIYKDEEMSAKFEQETGENPLVDFNLYGVKAPSLDAGTVAVYSGRSLHA